MWCPGQRILTEQDRSEWLAWRKERKRQQQRERRARYARIDYYPSDAALTVIECLVMQRAGYDFSSVLDRIVEEWKAKCHRNKEGPNSTEGKSYVRP